MSGRSSSTARRRRRNLGALGDEPAPQGRARLPYFVPGVVIEDLRVPRVDGCPCGGFQGGDDLRAPSGQDEEAAIQLGIVLWLCVYVCRIKLLSELGPPTILIQHRRWPNFGEQPHILGAP